MSNIHLMARAPRPRPIIEAALKAARQHKGVLLVYRRDVIKPIKMEQ